MPSANVRRSRVVALLFALVMALAAASGAVAKPGAPHHHSTKHRHSKPHHPRSHRHRPHAQAYFGRLRNGSLRMVTIPLGGRGGGDDPGDDYPAALKNRPMDSVFDQWREYNRECTSFVAWALASRNGFNMPFFANARDWGAMARARGYAVNGTPAPGSVAWSTAGTFGHVAYVQSVSGGSVYIEEYNHNLRGTFSARTVPASTFTGYIHFADRPTPPAPAPAPPASPAPPPPTPSNPAPSPPPPAPVTYSEVETPHHPVNTFTNPYNASGMGPAIAAGATVQVSCRVYAPQIASANPDGWWYRIASGPWYNQYYSPANTFLDGDPPYGPYSHNTDFSVPVC
jgi:surface antigen